MAPPPAKRQKRLVVLSSDDDEDWASPAEQVLEVKNARNEQAGTKATSKRMNVNKRSLPSRPRTKATDKSSELKKSTVPQSSPDPSPKKPAHRSKLTAKPATRQPSKPISSFFGIANHSQQVSGQRQAKRESPKVETPGIEDEEEDVIEDDSPIEDADELRGLQHTAHLVLDRRKPPFASTHNAHAAKQTQKLPAGSQRFKIAGGATGKSEDVSIAAVAASKNLDSRPWAERFGPGNLEELAVHKKKVADVHSWLENAFRSRDKRRLLILRGPSGVGKTATMSTLAKAMDLDISEWRDPVGSEYSSEGYFSISARFEEFLGRSGKFGTLSLTDSTGTEHAIPTSNASTNAYLTSRKVILLEEFPNTFLSTSSALRSFRSSILEYLAINTPSMEALYAKQAGFGDSVAPVVMIITETRLTTTTAASDSFTAHRLLGSEILGHPGVTIIDYNPVASTYLIKALSLVVQKEARQSGRRRIPGPSALKRLAEVGDVRSAIGSLEFLCLRGLDGDDWGGRVASRAKKGANTSSTLTKMESASLEMITQRESSLGLFHAVGKVVYNKRDDFKDDGSLPQPPDHMSEHVRPRVSQVSADQLIDETGTDTGTFVAALHENYVLSCEGSHFTEALNGCLDALSDSDLLASSWAGRFGFGGDLGGHSYQGTSSNSLRHNEICFQLAVRGLLFALPDPVKRRAHPLAGKSGAMNDTYKMFYPMSARLSRQMEEIDGIVDTWTDRFRVGVMPSGRPLHSAGHHFITSSSGEFRTVSAGSDGHEATEPVRSSRNCTKAELILERLPYLTKVEQRNPASTRLNELEKITQFHGIGAPAEDVTDEENVDDTALLSEWTTDHPVDGKYEKIASRAVIGQGAGQGGLDKYTTVVPVEEEVGKLYLSDDDIEDD